MARSLAPELVTQDDIVEHDLEGNPVGKESGAVPGTLHPCWHLRNPARRHRRRTRACGGDLAVWIAEHALRPVIHSGSFIGHTVPVWDIADRFGDTNLLVANMDQARDLAGTLADNTSP